MSRRQIDYDYDDYCDDDYYSEENEEEDEPSGEASAYMWQSPAAGDDQAALLDTLAHEFRALLSDRSLSRGAIDAALVASDYDVEVAVGVMRAASEREARERATSAARLEGAPSAMALAIGEGDEGEVAWMPEAAVTPKKVVGDAPHVFLFDSPSPDDVVRQQRVEGETRVRGAAKMKEGVRLPGGTLDLGRAKAKKVKAEVEAKAKATVKDENLEGGVGGVGRGGVVPERGQAAKGPKQRAREVKFPSAAKLAARAPSVAIVVAGHVDAGKVSDF